MKKDAWILFTKTYQYTIDGYDGVGRKIPKEKVKIEQKKHSFDYPPISLLYGGWLFSEEIENKSDLP